MRCAICGRRQRLQVELQAARQHGDRDLLRIRRREHELDVLGRLLERLQHRVERALRQHVHFVDQVDLVAADRRCVARVVEDLAHVVDAGVRRRIELEQVDEAAGIDVDAGRAHAARRRRDAGRAIQALRQDARDRRLADAAGAGQQVGMVKPAAVQRIRQRGDDVLLSDELAERLRSPLAGERLVGHAICERWDEVRLAWRQVGPKRAEQSISPADEQRRGGEPFPRHLQRIALAASFRT